MAKIPPILHNYSENGQHTTTQIGHLLRNGQHTTNMVNILHILHNNANKAGLLVIHLVL